MAELQSLEYSGDALATTDAHGDQCISTTNTLELMDRLGGDGCTRTADGMPEGNGATVWIGLGRVQPETARDGNGLCCKGFIAFDHVHFVQRQASLCQCQS